MRPMFALHKDASGNVLAAADFTYTYQVRDWLGRREFEPGDMIAFAECAVRPEELEPAPAFIETPPNPTVPELAETDDQPF